MSRRFSINQLPTGSYGITGSFSGSFTGDGSGLSGITATVAPAGPTTSVQFNDGLNNSGSSDFTFDKTTGMASVTSMSIANIYYPTTDGADRQVIKTDGAGNLEFGYPESVTIRVKNVSGGQLVKGYPVHATSSGTSGNIIGVVGADAGNPSLMPASAILNETLDDEQEGEALLSGYIQGVNTLGFTSGEIVYVAVGGGYTQTKPTGSALIQNLGIVAKVDPSNGSGIVYGSGRANDVPNIDNGYLWVGNSDRVPTAVSSASLFVDSASFAHTTSYATTTGLAQSASIENDISTNATYYPTLVDGFGDKPFKIDSALLSYNPSTNTLRTTTFQGDLQGTASYASLALTASYALNSPGGGSTDTGSLLVTASAALNVITFTKGDGSTFPITVDTGSGGGGGGAAFPYTGSAQITGSLDVIGPVTITYEGVPSLVVYGSGSADAVFIVSGSTGELFSVTDTLTGDLFTVTDADSNAIFNISSSYDIQLGNPIALSLYTTTTASIGTSPTTIYSIPTASYEGAWFEYTIRSGSNARAGNIMSMWSGSVVNFTETTTTDFGDTSGVTLGVLIVGAAMAFTGSATTDGWNLRTIIRSI